MTKSGPSYYEKNNKWFYFDIRYFRRRLTDKATKKAINSYIEDLVINPMNLISMKTAIKRVIFDIKDYAKNKHRYTFELDCYNHYSLTHVDGKPVEMFSKKERY